MPENKEEIDSKRASVKLSPRIPTISGAYRLYDIESKNSEGEDRDPKDIQSDFVEKLKVIGTELGENLRDREQSDLGIIGDMLGGEEETKLQEEEIKFQLELRSMLSSRLPKIEEEIEANESESVKDASEKMLAKMLGIDETDELDRRIKEKLQDKGYSGEQTERLKESMKKFINMRIILGLKERLSIQAVINGEIQEQEAKELRERSELYEKIAKKGSFIDVQEEVKAQPRKVLGLFPLGKKHTTLSPEKYKQLTENAEEINPGLYATMNDDGEPSFVMTQINKTNIDTIIEKSGNKRTINWSSIPNKKPSYLQRHAEIQCLKNDKYVTFDGKQTFLSKTKPREEGESYALWCANIMGTPPKPGPNKPLAWKTNRNIPLSRLIRGVIGNDESKLRDLWLDIEKNHPSKTWKSGIKPLSPDNIFNILSKEQKKTLVQGLENRINEVNEKIGQLNDGSNPALQAELELSGGKKLEDVLTKLVIRDDKFPAALFKKPDSNEIRDGIAKEIREKFFKEKAKEAVKQLQKLAEREPPLDRNNKAVKKVLKKYAEVLRDHKDNGSKDKLKELHEMIDAGTFNTLLGDHKNKVINLVSKKGPELELENM